MKKYSIVFILLLFSCFNKSKTTDSFKNVKKINGVTFDGPSSPPITNNMFNSIKELNATWIATTPEAFTYHNTLEVKSFFKEGQWYGETIDGSITVIKIAKKLGYKVMMKPHIGFTYDVSDWKVSKNANLDEYNNFIQDIVEKVKNATSVEEVNKYKGKLKSYDKKLEQYEVERKNYISKQKKLTLGKWRGDFDIKDSLNWKTWESGYEKFIMDCAKIADSTQVDLFCIGTELSISAVKRESFWRQLIKKVRDIYNGPITFSSNWDNYKNIKFWNDLDYIGISAYFPLSDKKTPNVNDAIIGWESYLNSIRDISAKYSKPILFTEYGYRSVEYAAQKPWVDKDLNGSNEQVQADLYDGLFKSFWEQEWFIGGFIWKCYYSGNGGLKSFSPVNKLAEKIIKKRYSK